MKTVLVESVEGKKIDEHPQLKKMFEYFCQKIIKAVE